tara:strand:+ start:9610 stop:10728 length:1119 start_codon:yes stop_codon:yes gene_type:complete
MSLYDKYHSDININYMYNLVSQIIKKDTDEDILNNTEFKNIFKENSKQIFTEVNSDVLEDINRVLLDKHVLQFTQAIQLKKPIKEDNNSVADKYNELIQSRNIPLIEPNETKVNNPFLNLQTNSDLEKNNLQIIEEESPISELIEDKQSTPSSNDSIIPVIIEKNYPQYKIISSKRSNIQSSRFHYVYNLSKNNIKSTELKKISKIVIPVEENYIFSSPILFLQIKELNYSSSFELDHIISDDNKKYGYYKSLENNTINLDKDIEKITIDIRDVSETRYDKIDIAKVNVVEIKNSEIEFTCTNITENNYSQGDYIKIINNYTKSLKLNFPLKISRIEGNKIICPYESKVSKKITDVDMKLLNTSNQNIIYFN